ncbi:MAG: MSCRAMM family adhesin SdrC, partial [Clostridia bacterium]|nr:MSCRAMM family adhesin SdrC [Clostridia bacterium]
MKSCLLKRIIPIILVICMAVSLGQTSMLASADDMDQAATEEAVTVDDADATADDSTSVENVPANEGSGEIQQDTSDDTADAKESDINSENESSTDIDNDTNEDVTIDSGEDSVNDGDIDTETNEESEYGSEDWDTDVCPHGNGDDCAICAVQALIDALPTVEEVEEMDEDGQIAIYYQAQDACDAYDALSEDEQEQVDITKLEELFDFFNGQIMTVEDDGYYYDEKEGAYMVEACTEVVGVDGSGLQAAVAAAIDSEENNHVVKLLGDQYLTPASSTSKTIKLNGTVTI